MLVFSRDGSYIRYSDLVVIVLVFQQTRELFESYLSNTIDASFFIHSLWLFNFFIYISSWPGVKQCYVDWKLCHYVSYMVFSGTLSL